MKLYASNMAVNKRDLINLFIKPKSSDVINDCIELIESRFNTIFETRDRKILRCSLSRVKARFIKFYAKCCSRKIKNFLKHHAKWMSIDYKLPVNVSEPTPTENIADPAVVLAKKPCTSKMGRPKLSYDVQSGRLKRRTVNEISKLFEQNTNLAIDTAKYIAARNGDGEVVSGLTNIKGKKSIEKETNRSMMSPDAALALLLECELTKEQYRKVRNAAISHGHDFLPSYDSVIEAKKKCRPKNVVVTETEATVPLQDLVDHTIDRIIHSQSDFISRQVQTFDSQTLKAKLIICWGFDGSSSQSQFNQEYNTVDDHHETSVFVTSTLPLKLTCGDTILWANATPQSVKFCRPKTVKFEKESAELTRRTKEEFEEEISNLNPTTCFVGGKTLEVECDFFLTMLDGKCLLHISDEKSSSVCYICGCPPSKMNDLHLARSFPINKDMLTKGCTMLHLWMRFLDVVTHISYKLPIKLYQVKGENNKKIVAARKKEIQNRFWNELHLRLDFPRPSGGTSTTGSP